MSEKIRSEMISRRTNHDDTDHNGRKKIRAFEGLPKGGPFRIECRCGMSAIGGEFNRSLQHRS